MMYIDLLRTMGGGVIIDYIDSSVGNVNKTESELKLKSKKSLSSVDNH